MKKILFFTVLSLLLNSCATINPNKKDFDSQIQEKYWKLISINVEKVVMAKNQEREVYFILKNDKTLKGFSGCNSFGGNYSISKSNKMKFLNISSTEMACPDLKINEQKVLNLFTNEKYYTIEKDTLKMYQSGKIVATFEAVYF